MQDKNIFKGLYKDSLVRDSWKRLKAIGKENDGVIKSVDTAKDIKWESLIHFIWELVLHSSYSEQP
jgi:hypothetical protein